MGALISFFNISASIRWHCSCFKRTNTETVNRNSTTYLSNTSFQHPFFKQVLSLFLSAFLVILHVMLYSLGSSNYSFSVSIMGRSASWVFRKLHGNSFIVKCSINACVPPPPPPQKSIFSKVQEGRYFRIFTVALITVVTSRTRCVTYRGVPTSWSPWKALEFNFRIKGCLKKPWMGNNN